MSTLDDLRYDADFMTYFRDSDGLYYCTKYLLRGNWQSFFDHTYTAYCDECAVTPDVVHYTHCAFYAFEECLDNACMDAINDDGPKHASAYKPFFCRYM